MPSLEPGGGGRGAPRPAAVAGTSASSAAAAPAQVYRGLLHLAAAAQRPLGRVPPAKEGGSVRGPAGRGQEAASPACQCHASQSEYYTNTYFRINFQIT
jgi:hypothetical protein